MNFTQAIEVVNAFQNDYRLQGLLETLEYMQANLDDLDRNEHLAFGVVFREMGKLFAPA